MSNHNGYTRPDVLVSTDWSDPIIAYCRIGERSSHTWFVLTYWAIPMSATTTARGQRGAMAFGCP